LFCIWRSRAVTAPGEPESEAHELGVRQHAFKESFPTLSLVQLFQSGAFVDESNYLSSTRSPNAHCLYNRANEFENHLSATQIQYPVFATPLFFSFNNSIWKTDTKLDDSHIEVLKHVTKKNHHFLLIFRRLDKPCPYSQISEWCADTI
jgi:hypothetical protein